MANDFEVRVGVSVDENELKGLEQRLLALKDEKGKIKLDVDTESGQQKIRSLYNYFNKMSKSVKLTPSMDMAKVKKDMSEMARYFNQATKLISRGMNPSNILTGSETTIRQMSETLRKYPEEAVRTYKSAMEQVKGLNADAAQHLADYINMDGISDKVRQETDKMNSALTDLVKSGETNLNKYTAITAEWQTKVKDAFTSVENSMTSLSGKNTKIQQDAEAGTWYIAQNTFAGIAEDIDKARASMVSFNDAGEQVKNNIKEIETSFDTVESAAETFKKAFSQVQQASVFEQIKSELDKVGVALDESEQDFSKYITSINTSMDKTGKLITSIKASIQGNDISATFKQTDILGQQGLQAEKINIFTSQAKALKQYEQELQNIIRLTKQSNSTQREANKAIYQDQITESAKRAEQLKEQITNQERLNQVTDEYVQKQKVIANEQAQRTQTQQQDNYLKQVTQSLNQLEQYQKKISSLQNSGKFNTNQIEAYKQEIDKILQSLTELGITYNSVSNKFNVDFGGTSSILKTEDAIEKLTQKIEEFRRITSQTDAKQMDFIDNQKVQDVTQSLKTLEQLQNKINSLQNSGKLNTNQIEGYKQEIQQITEELKSLGVTYDSVKNKFSFSSTDLSGLVNSADSLEKLNNLLNQFKNTINNINAKQMDFIDNQKVQEAIQLLEQLQKKKLELEKAQLSGASSSYIDALIQDINRLEQELQQATQEQLSFNQTVGQSDTYQSAFANSVNESAMAMEKLQSSTSNLNNGFDGVIARCASMAASFAIFDQLQNALYSSVDAVKELDSAMTSLQMVTEQSDESIQNMMSGYADMANELGVTLKTVAEGSSEWLNCFGHYKFS